MSNFPVFGQLLAEQEDLGSIPALSKCFSLHKYKEFASPLTCWRMLKCVKRRIGNILAIQSEGQQGSCYCCLCLIWQLLAEAYKHFQLHPYHLKGTSKWNRRSPLLYLTTAIIQKVPLQLLLQVLMLLPLIPTFYCRARTARRRSFSCSAASWTAPWSTNASQIGLFRWSSLA